MNYTPETPFGRSVRDDALAQGYTPEFAAYLTKQIEHPPTDGQIEKMSKHVRVFLGVRMSADRRASAPDEFADLAAAVGADALLPALRAAALPLSEATALVRDAIDMRTMTVHGARIDNLRAAISARTYWNQR